MFLKDLGSDPTKDKFKKGLETNYNRFNTI